MARPVAGCGSISLRRSRLATRMKLALMIGSLISVGGERVLCRRRTVYVIGALDLGGAERHLQQVLPRLMEHGWEVDIYCLGRPGVLADEFKANGIRVIPPPLEADGRRHMLPYRVLRLGLAALSLWWLLVRRRPAVVHFFLPLAYLVGAPVAMAALCQNRIMSRRSLNLYQAVFPGSDFVERFLHSHMSVVLGNSRAVVCELASEGAPPERLRLLYNGIEPPVPQRPRTAVRAELGLAPDALVMVIVANLIPYKGHADLLAGLGEVAGRLPAGWCLLVVGRDDGIGPALKEQAEQLGIAGHLCWLGVRGDVPDLLAAADVAILCSWEEGFSNSVLEGMASGLPMVVTDVGGNAEVVIDGESGLVVPPRDPAALGEALARLAGDQALRKRLGASAHERVARHFTLDECVNKYERLYVSLLENRTLPELDDAGTVVTIDPRANDEIEND